MRTTLLGQTRQTLMNLRSASSRIARATQELSSGLRVSKPSDSPADAGGIVRARSDLAEIASNRSKFESLQAELRAVDGSLSEAVDVLQRVLTLGTQGATDTQTAQSRETIQNEVDGLLRHLVSIGNSVHNGRRVFAGSDETAPPFLFDETTNTATYQGAPAGRTLSFPDGRAALISLPGDEIFLHPEEAVGSGRTAQTTGTPAAPPVGIGVTFGGELDGSISVDLDGFFLAGGPPAGAAGGDTVSVTFQSKDGSIYETVTTPPLTGGETATDIAALLNTEIAANTDLAGLVEVADEGGALKLSVSETAGVGFDFTSVSTGSVTTGLEGGGSIGGFSAEEIAAALNEEITQHPQLFQANARFEARDGEIVFDSNVDVTITVVDFARGTEFASGLEGTHRVGGQNAANVFESVAALSEALGNNDSAAIAEAVQRLQVATDHVAQSQGFYGGTLNRVEVTLDNLSRSHSVNSERLSNHQDADVVAAIAELQAASTAEELAIKVAGRDRPNLLDVIG